MVEGLGALGVLGVAVCAVGVVAVAGAVCVEGDAQKSWGTYFFREKK